ncbi:hypothetical protein RF11_01137 [Thelohanellus kitauei]|uniref:Uncharacterized protein n=1 Tax=Thelohanellus kitauei TaxID=669202 RepID=A0A0C2J597_THEKT|nr:hypothetical protein RF11_01137 [Thelohanellus kitauei]
MNQRVSYKILEFISKINTAFYQVTPRDLISYFHPTKAYIDQFLYNTLFDTQKFHSAHAEVPFSRMFSPEYMQKFHSIRAEVPFPRMFNTEYMQKFHSAHAEVPKIIFFKI